jgi:large subunit ribosomal protein L15
MMNAEWHPIHYSAFRIHHSALDLTMSMLHEITARAPRNKRGMRKGRGRSAGKGKTAGRGTKGAKARVGKYVKIGHEHGQTPIYRRLPKRGFSNENFERRFHIVNVADLSRFDDNATVDAAALIEAGLVPDTRWPVKILGDGAIGKKLTVVAGKFSRTAYQKITEAGGAAQNLKNEPFAFPKEKKKFVPREKEAGGGKKKKGKGGEEAAPAEGGEQKAEAPKSEAKPE